MRDPKALEEDPKMGWLLEVTISLEGESPKRIGLLEATIGLEGESPKWIV